MRVVWVNRKAALEGGCERTMAATAQVLSKQYDVESILLYELGSPIESSFTKNFDGAFPVVNLQEQLNQMEPDAVFSHRVRTEWLESIASMTHLHRVAFVHDHDLLCLRRHKLTIQGSSPCTKSSGLACALRCGPVQRGPKNLELRSPLSLRRAQTALAKMDAVLAPSEYLVNLLAEVGVSGDFVHRLAPFTQLPTPRDGTRVVPNRLLFVGALTRGKGVGQLLEAMSLLGPQVELDVLGDGPQRDAFHRQAGSLGLAGRVHFFGKVDKSTVYEQLEKAALVVVPSIAPETFGLVGVEALAAEVPVVGTRAGGVTDWLRDGVTGSMVNAGDIEALAEAISSSLTSPLRSKRRAMRGRERVLELINEEAHGRRLGHILRLATQREREAA